MNSKSTGVDLPKIETVTFNLDLSSSISSTKPLKLWKGPSDTLTSSPISKITFDLGLSTLSVICSISLLASLSLKEDGLKDLYPHYLYDPQVHPLHSKKYWFSSVPNANILLCKEGSGWITFETNSLGFRKVLAAGAAVNMSIYE